MINSLPPFTHSIRCSMVFLSNFDEKYNSKWKITAAKSYHHICFENGEEEESNKNSNDSTLLLIARYAIILIFHYD